MTLSGHRLPLPEGYELHWYTLERVLGQGGFGITYLAQDNNLQRLVAIKEFLPRESADRRSDHSVQPRAGEHSEHFAWGLKSFLTEARTLARFKHPNIIRVISVFEQNNTAYMVMEYENGDDFAHLLRQQKSIGEQELKRIFLPIIEGLHQVHESGFIHRDIKPANIYIRQDQSSVLLDFGSARRAILGETQDLTQIATFGYAPLEQYNDGFGQQGPWTDIYALAASMYRAITGERPAEALARSAALSNNEPDPMLVLTPRTVSGYPPNFLEAINAGLQLKPTDRPQSAMHWATQLSGDESLTTHIVNSATEHLSTPEKQQFTPPATSPAKRSKPASLKPLLAALGLTLGIGLAAYYFYNRVPISPAAAPLDLRPLSVVVPPAPKEYVSTPGDTSDLPAPGTLAIASAITVNPPYEQTSQLENALHQAATIYRRVIDIAPEDPEAVAASSAVAGKYAALVNTAWFRADKDRALSVLGQGITLVPQSKALQQLYSEIQTGLVTTDAQAMDKLLRVAEDHLRAGRFTRPAGNNAVMAYHQVLLLQSDNKLANQQLKLIADIFADLAKQKLAAEQFSEAARTIEQGLVIYPQHSGLATLRLRFTQGQREDQR